MDSRQVRMLRATSCTIALAVLLLEAVPPARAAEPLLSVSAGVFDVARASDVAPEFGLQLRAEKLFWLVGSQAGVMFTPAGAVNAYAGFDLELPVGRRLVLRGSVAPGVYVQNGGKDLAHVVEFRSGLEAAVRFASGLRVGAEFYHLSNGRLADRNPGANSLVLTVTMPLRSHAPTRAAASSSGGR